jgi:pilus assembly protein CpaF
MISIGSRMSLRENLDGGVDPSELNFQRKKVSVHEQLVDSLDLTLLPVIENDALRGEIRHVAQQIVKERRKELKDLDQDRLLDGLMDEVFGLGPLEPLLADDDVTDILVNHAHEVYVERKGRLELTDVVFADDAHLMRVVQRVVARIGRRIDEVSPMVDARLEDGSRVHAIVPPLSLNGPTISIRRFGVNPYGIEDLVEMGSIRPEMAEFLQAATESRTSFLISGGTGSGKTTLLNALTKFIPSDERIVTIEDSAELILQHHHCVRLETRDANTEGAGMIDPRTLVRNSLRMRPDRIIVGEVRGPEALDMLQAMNTGHEGSLTTIHANDTRDALARLEMMVAMTGFQLPVTVVREYISAGIALVVQLSRLKGGPRRCMRISEIVAVENGQFVVEDVFGFEQTGLDEEKRAIGHFYATGYKPKCLERLKASGIELPDSLFEKRTME